MKSFTCPHCKVKQYHVGVLSECTQELNLASDDWNNLDVKDTKYIYCLECGQKLPKLYKKLVEAGILL